MDEWMDEALVNSLMSGFTKRKCSEAALKTDAD